MNEWFVYALFFAAVSYVELRYLSHAEKRAQLAEKRLGTALGALREIVKDDMPFPKQLARHALRDLGEIEGQPDA